MDLKTLKAFLIRHGHSPESLEGLPPEELNKLYTEEVQTNTIDFFKHINNDETLIVINANDADIGQLTQQIRDNARDTPKLIEIMRKGLEDFPYADIADVLTLNSKSISAHKLQKILRIAFREFQEVLLDRIAEQLKELPKEEYKVMMGHYEKKRDDIARLKNTIQELSIEKKRQQILKMAHFKLQVIQGFLPTYVFNDSYKEYLNNTPEKLRLVDEVLSLTGMHSKKYLKNLPMDELEEMKNRLIEDKLQDERDRKIFAQYTQMLDEAMFGSDEQEFSSVCIKIITGLNQRQILMITEYLNAKNPVFVNRFNTLLRDFRKTK